MKNPVPWFDLPTACAGALIMGGLVGWVNIGHGLLPALSAAMKQGVYTFFVAGLVVQLCRWLAAREVSLVVAASMAVLLPTILTVMLVFTLHSVKGTPEPLHSTIPVVVMSLISFSFFTWRGLKGEPGDLDL